MRFLALAAAFVLALAMPATAHEFTQGNLTVDHPTARPVLSGRPGAAYLTIINNGDQADHMLGASSPAFDAAEVHESYEENGVAKMRRVEGLEIPPGGKVSFAPGGLHLMLFGATQDFEAGDKFPLTLSFEHAGKIEVVVWVVEMSGNHGMTHHGGMDMDHGGNHEHQDAATH